MQLATITKKKLNSKLKFIELVRFDLQNLNSMPIFAGSD